MTTNPQTWPNTLKAGCDAYLDTFSGLVPVKVLRVLSTSRLPLHPIPTTEAEVEVTRTVKGYKRGEKITFSTRYTIPKGAIVTRGYHRRILPYNVEVTA